LLCLWKRVAWIFFPWRVVDIPLNTVKNANFEPFSQWLWQSCCKFLMFLLVNISLPEEMHTRCFSRPGSLMGAKNSGTINQFLLRFCVHRNKQLYSKGYWGSSVSVLYGWKCEISCNCHTYPRMWATWQGANRNS
jgi:hypothetical protein